MSFARGFLKRFCQQFAEPAKLEAFLRQELVVKDKEHQEELDRAMRALAIKDKQLAAKDEEIQRQLAAKDEENSLQSKDEETHKQLGKCA